MNRTACLLGLLLAATARAGDPFTVTTPGKAGSGGVVPALTGSGPLTPGSADNTVQVSGSPAGVSATFVIGFTAWEVPFKGGVLGPSPDVLLPGLPLDGTGGLSLPFALTGDAPPGLSLWTQAWISDPGALGGLSATNTLRLDIQPAPVLERFGWVHTPVAGAAGAHSAQLLVDLDDDGRDDLVADIGGQLVSLRSLGDGRLEPVATTTHAEGFTTLLRCADLDGDGRPDLLASGGDLLSTALGLGDGGFAPSQVVHAEGHEALVTGDLDADGTPDLCLIARPSGAPSHLVTRLGQGDGGFEGAFSRDVGTWPIDAVLTDADLDGQLDALAADWSAAAVWFLGGSGDGTLAPPAVAATIQFPERLFAADLDADGAPDLVAMNDLGTRVFQGLGDGTFTAVATSPLNSQQDALFVDLDGDGLTDLVTSDSSPAGPSTLVQVAVGRADGTFDAPVTEEVPPMRTLFGDLDGDGRLDLAGLAGELTDGVIVSLHRDPTAHVRPWWRGAASPGLDLGGMAIGDLTGDGLDDLVALGASNDAAYVFPALGDGALGPAEPFGVGGGLNALALADMDVDGDADVLLKGSGLWILPQLPGGVIDSPGSMNNPIPGLSNSLAVGDLDDDGLPDAVSCADELTHVLLGTGGVAMDPVQSYATWFWVRAVQLADIDLDGDLDSVSVSPPTDRVVLMRGAGDGSLTQFALYVVGDGPTDVAVGDLDLDGWPDLVSADADGNGLTLLRGQGAGLFSVDGTLDAPDRPLGVDVADLDGDGWPEVLASQRDTGHVLVFPGPGATPGLDPLRLYVGPRSEDVLTGDLDGDGDLDVVARLPDTLTLLLQESSG